MARAVVSSGLPLPEIKKDKAGLWGHASGRIWHREKDLLGRPGLDRLFAASSVDEIRRLLLEHRYPQKDTVLEMICAERCEIYELLATIAPDGGFHHVLLLGDEGHNLKTALKTSLLVDDPDKDSFMAALGNPSLINHEILWRSVVRGEKGCGMPEWADVLVTRARGAYAEDYDPATIDRSIDRDIHSIIADMAADLDTAWLSDYFVRVRDLRNLETLLRAKHRGLSEAAFDANLLPDGILDREEWLHYLKSDDQTVVDDLCDTPYKELSTHFASYGEKGGAALFTRDRDKLLYDYLAGGIKILTGAPRVIAYVMARECEFKNTRLALSVLADGLKAESVRPLRRDFQKR